LVCATDVVPVRVRAAFSHVVVAGLVFNRCRSVTPNILRHDPTVK
jgi:hypothetical protein